MKTTLMPIKDFARVLPGFPLKSALKHDPKGTHQVILPKHLPAEGAYQYSKEDVLRIIPSKSPKAYLVNKEDILFVPRGPRNMGVYMEDCPPLSIAHGSLFIIKVNTKLMLPEFLAWSLAQEKTQAKITEIRTGASTPMVPRTGLEHISIPVPDLEHQAKIAKLARLHAHEMELLHIIHVKRQSIHRQHDKNLARKLFRNALKTD